MSEIGSFRFSEKIMQLIHEDADPQQIIEEIEFWGADAGEWETSSELRTLPPALIGLNQTQSE